MQSLQRNEIEKSLNKALAHIEQAVEACDIEQLKIRESLREIDRVLTKLDSAENLLIMIRIALGYDDKD